MSSFKDHFSAGADDYARHRPIYPQSLIDALAQFTPRGEAAWDAGCGSGQLSVGLATRFDAVLATDPAVAQIERAATHPRVRYSVASAEASGLPAASIDLAVSAQAAHWFDLPRYYEEVRRVTRPDATIALVCYGLMEIDEQIDAVVDRFYRGASDPYWPAERRLVDAGYRTLPFPFDELVAPVLAIEHRWDFAALVGYLRSWSAVIAMRRADRGDLFDLFARELRNAWGDPSALRTIRWPLGVRVGRR